MNYKQTKNISDSKTEVETTIAKKGLKFIEKISGGRKKRVGGRALHPGLPWE